MEQVTLEYARDHLEDLLTRAQRGEAVEIADSRFGTVRLLPVGSAKASILGSDRSARHPAELDLSAPRITDAIEPFVPLKEPRKPGRWAGLIPPPPDDVFAPMTEEELKDWYGED